MPQEKLTALCIELAHRKGAPVTMNDGGGLYFRKQTAGGATWTTVVHFDPALGRNRKQPPHLILKPVTK
jgi:hypothetical protein